MTTLRKVGIGFHVRPFDVFTSPLHLRYSAVSLRPQRRVPLPMHESRFSRAATTILHGPLKDHKECEHYYNLTTRDSEKGASHISEVGLPPHR